MMKSTKDKEVIVPPNYRKTKNSLTGQQSIAHLILVFCQIDRLIIAGIIMLRLISLSFFVSALAFASEDLHSIDVGYSYSDIRNGDSEVTSELNNYWTN